MTANYADNSNFWKKFHHRVHRGSDDEAWRIISSTAKAQSEDKKSIDTLNQTIRERKMGIKDLSGGEVASIGMKQIKCWTKEVDELERMISQYAC